MLEIQKFIIANPKNWKELLKAEPYSLLISETEDLVLFKYTQGVSDFSYEICNEARGIILEKDTWKVIRFAFKKFWNIGEGRAAAIDWETAWATTKLDGSLMTLYYYQGKWRLATNGGIDAYKQPLDNGGFKTFGELFDVAAQASGLDYSKLNKNYNYTFELCSPFNKVVISYSEPRIYHIATRDMKTLKEIDTSIGVAKPSYYYLENREDYEAFVKTMGEDQEGIVVCDKDYNRVKIKTETYFTLHHMVHNHHITVIKAVELIRSNEHKELLSYFPEYEDFFKKVELKLAIAAQTVQAIQEEVDNFKKKELARIDFVNYVNNNILGQMRRLWFMAYDNKLLNWFNYNEDLSESMQIKINKDIVKLFNIED